MARTEVGQQGRSSEAGLNRVDSAPSRGESNQQEGVDEGEQLIDVDDGPPKARPRATTTREAGF